MLLRSVVIILVFPSAFMLLTVPTTTAAGIRHSHDKCAPFQGILSFKSIYIYTVYLHWDMINIEGSKNNKFDCADWTEALVSFSTEGLGFVVNLVANFGFETTLSTIDYVKHYMIRVDKVASDNLRNLDKMLDGNGSSVNFENLRLNMIEKTASLRKSVVFDVRGLLGHKKTAFIHQANGNTTELYNDDETRNELLQSLKDLLTGLKGENEHMANANLLRNLYDISKVLK